MSQSFCYNFSPEEEKELYKRNATGWSKHIDFIILDEIVLMISFLLGMYIRHNRCKAAGYLAGQIFRIAVAQRLGYVVTFILEGEVVAEIIRRHKQFHLVAFYGYRLLDMLDTADVELEHGLPALAVFGLSYGDVIVLVFAHIDGDACLASAGGVIKIADLHVYGHIEVAFLLTHSQESG